MQKVFCFIIFCSHTQLQRYFNHEISQFAVYMYLSSLVITWQKQAFLEPLSDTWTLSCMCRKKKTRPCVFSYASLKKPNSPYKPINNIHVHVQWVIIITECLWDIYRVYELTMYGYKHPFKYMYTLWDPRKALFRDLQNSVHDGICLNPKNATTCMLVHVLCTKACKLLFGVVQELS